MKCGYVCFSHDHWMSDWVEDLLASESGQRVARDGDQLVIPSAALREYLEGRGMDASPTGLNRFYERTGTQQSVRRVNGKPARVVLVPAPAEDVQGQEESRWLEIPSAELIELLEALGMDCSPTGLNRLYRQLGAVRGGKSVNGKMLKVVRIPAPESKVRIEEGLAAEGEWLEVPSAALVELLEALGMDVNARALGRLYAEAGAVRKVRKVSGRAVRFIRFKRSLTEQSCSPAVDLRQQEEAPPGPAAASEEPLHWINRELVDLFVEERLSAAGDCVALTGSELHLLLQLVGIQRKGVQS